MWYLIVGTDVNNSTKKRLLARDEHLARLKLLKQQGRLLVAGPCPAIDNEQAGACGFTGSAMIAEFESLQQAQDWANQDPYMTSGVYCDVMVKPFKKVLP